MKARNSPNEIYALLIGSTPHRNIVEIEKFVYPPLVSSSPSGLECSGKVWASIVEAAWAEKKLVVGSIHSHPNWAPVMSPNDLFYHKQGKDKISGIIEATNRRTRVCFWHHASPVPCTLEYV
jgi:proteasome lid subunit RPN8/RPN11